MTSFPPSSVSHRHRERSMIAQYLAGHKFSLLGAEKRHGSRLGKRCSQKRECTEHTKSTASVLWSRQAVLITAVGRYLMDLRNRVTRAHSWPTSRVFVCIGPGTLRSLCADLLYLSVTTLDSIRMRHYLFAVLSVGLVSLGTVGWFRTCRHELSRYATVGHLISLTVIEPVSSTSSETATPRIQRGSDRPEWSES